MRKQLLIVGMTTFKRIVGNKKVIETILVLGLLLLLPLTLVNAATAPSLGAAASFAVLAGTTVTNTGPSVITGDVGVSPGTAVTGFPPGIVVPPGAIHSADTQAGNAQTDLTIAYNALVGEATDFGVFGPTDLGGLTLVPGVYTYSSTVSLTGVLTLNGGANDVWVFQIGSTLTTISGSQVVLINGAKASNVFWQVGSSATIGTGSTFMGNILALTSISVTTGATVYGRVLARNGAVTLDTNIIGIEGISLAPLSDTNTVGDSHTVTATVSVAGSGNPVVNTPVTFTVVLGPNALLSGSALTDGNGHASFTYTSGSQGTDTIEASFVNIQGTTVTSNQVTKTWTLFVLPESALGALTALGVGFAAFGVVKMKRARNEKR
jgi:hypothetical protein